MIKALLLIFDPRNTWDRIVEARRAYGFILVCFLLPTVLLSCAGELAGNYEWGKKQGTFGKVMPLPDDVLISYGIAQFVLSILMVLIAAKVMKNVAESFHRRTTTTEAFRLTAYAFSPLFLVRLIDACPLLNVWIAWGIGMVLVLAVLYNGLPRALNPDPANAFGLYVVNAILFLLVSALGRLVTWVVLTGRFTLPLNAMGLDFLHR